ncbi:MAG: C25 family cysteine peptidase, partial [Anaerolineae bacterium]
HTLQTSFNAGDQLALGGHLFRDASDEEIVLADLGEDLIRSYGTNEELTLADERLPFAHDMSAGDVLAAGNVIDEDNAGDPHDRVEILVAHSDGSVDVYQYNYVPGSEDFTQHSFSTTFDEDDAFAVGNISGGFGTEDEAVVANDSGWIYIYNNLSSSPTGEFLSDFTAGDQFAVGDVSGNSSYDEAIVGDVSADRVRVYVYQYLGEFDEDYTITGLELAAEDGLAVADVHGTDKEEIIIADASEDSIAVYSYDTTADDFALISEFGYPFQPEDRLAAGDVFAAGKAQIVVARGSSSGLHREGDVEILSFLAGEAPGDRDALDELVDQGGAWADRLHSSWDDTDGGYLLIVGEIEIIPTFSPSWDLFASDHGSVDYSDRDYASTRGDANRPELSIGRIIGNSAESLEKPIQAALDILSGDAEFDNSDAYCVSGRNRGASGESTDIDFTERRESIADTLRDEGFDVVEEHEPSVTSFFANDANKDFILIAGHGGRRSWDVIHRDDVDGRFSPGRARPTIYASACSTGRYPGGYGIAEAFLHRDAAAFIGSTETSISPWSARMAENFFSNVDPAHTIGSALRDAKIHRLGVNTWAWDPAYNQYHCAIHHLYGDPKLGPEWLAESAGAEVSSPIPLTEGQSSLKVTIPDYEVTPVDGGDRVEIPGGDMVIVYGEPMVPAFSVDVAVPAGTQVQDVVLSERGGLVTDTGLDIQVATPAVEGYQRAEADSEGEGWWPDHDFGWIAQEAADGSATLQIVIYPFFYHSETTNVRFYREYTFEIETAASQVEITGWSMDRSTYAQGETVRADVYVLNSGKGPQELVAEAAVRSEASGEIVGGLPLRTLRKVEGLASFALAWDSTGFAPGGYALELAIRDAAGTLLDSDTQDVTVGRSAGEITALGAAPAVFDIGETVGVSLTFENVGTVIITGTATIIVSDGQGDSVETWDFDVPELEPGQDVTFDEKWDTAGMAHGTYMVVGHVGCGGQTAGPRAVEISSRRRVYLPLTMRAD